MSNWIHSVQSAHCLLPLLAIHNVKRSFGNVYTRQLSTVSVDRPLLSASQPIKLSPAESRKLYRTFLRQGSKAVMSTTRQRKQIWQIIRAKFKENLDETDPEKLGDLWIRSQNTLVFLESAAQKKGLESKIVRNLCDFQFYQNRFNNRPYVMPRNMPSNVSNIHAHAMDDLDLVIEMLNQELDLCL
ncbi:hypothetical protein CLU79DRAFT_778803 [Phycomyces nitens]|nr:hypothetical protein CLU79DRAFT_778803 [Phycomyces nitens]